MASDTVVIRGRPGEQDLYFTVERVIAGLCQLLERGRLDEAVEVYMRCQEDVGYSLMTAAQGHPERFRAVANLLFRARDFHKAAQCCEELDETDKAALLFERAGDFGRAAEMYARTGDKPRAAACFQKAGEYRTAAGLYDEVGDTHRAAECRQRAGDVLAPAEGAVRVMDGFDQLKALPLFQEASLTDLKALYHLATLVEHGAGDVLIDTGRPAEALWILLEGEVEVWGERGGTLATLGVGAHVGEMSLLDDSPANVRVVVKKALRALRLEHRGLKEALGAHDGLALAVYRVMARDLAARLRETSARVVV